MEPNARIVDPLVVFKASRRFDLVFKVALAKAWAGGDAKEIREAEEAYLEMVRSRNGFFEDEPRRETPAEFLESFRRTVDSIRERGYDFSRAAIPVDENDELLNGAHRLAACVAFSRPCPVVLSDCWKAGGSEWRTFRKGRIHPAVEAWGIRRYLEIAGEDGALAAEFGGIEAHPAAPFPDWTRRTGGLGLVRPFISALWCRLTLPFRNGSKREKVERRLFREKRIMSSYAALAAYWKERMRNGG